MKSNTVKKEDIVFKDNAPVSIVRVANGFKIIAAREPYAYPPEGLGRMVPSEEYVFPALQEAFEFLTTHYEDG